MKDIKVVIGANFGDEGKGLITDYLCAKATTKCLNVLTNGGSQRAHTVDTADGVHHVFKHFGSGTVAGADNFYSRFYIINPMQFHVEYEELSKKILMPNIYCDSLCVFSTPWDGIVNQIVEESRGDKKHGSCGMGIWETIKRARIENNNECIKYSIYDFNTFELETKRTILRNLRDTYFIKALNEYGIDKVPTDWLAIWNSEILIDNFIFDINFFVTHTIQINGINSSVNKLFNRYDTIVFENGQGLLLDGNNSFYGPDFTTPSSTGVYDAFELIYPVFKPAEINIELCYVSRTYMTRHGAGKFITECNKSFINNFITDTTNVYNQFQDNLRYGELIEDNLRKRVIEDSKPYVNKYNAKVSLYMTHTNEHMCDIEKLHCDQINNIYVSDTKFRDSIKSF